MSYYNGPKMVTNGLSLHLDVGSIKSFAGEPTVNLALFQANSIAWNTDYSTVVTQSNDSTVTYQGRASRKIIAASTWNIYAYSYTLTASTVFTVSFKVKRSDGAAPTFGNGYIYTSAGSTFPTVIVVAIGDGWYQCYCLYNGTSSTLNSLTGFTTSQTGTFYITDWQAEAKSYMTPYVYGTRGYTTATGGGWADLTSTQNATLGTSNKFENYYGGAITGDGTSNSGISVVNSTLYSLGYNNFTYACWAKVGTTSANVFYEGRGASLVGTLWTINYGGSNCMGLFLTDKPYSQQKIYIQPTPYGSSVVGSPHYYVVVADRVNNVARYFIDGVSYGTTSISATTGSVTPDSGYNGSLMYDLGGAYFTGSMSMFSIYPNRALTQGEVLQNYNATKARFGL